VSPAPEIIVGGVEPFAGGFVALGDYYATGEGRVMGVAMARTAAGADLLFRARIGAPFLVSVHRIAELPQAERNFYDALVPIFVQEQIHKAWQYGGAAEYAAIMHVNHS
jgi:hypothetical protein